MISVSKNLKEYKVHEEGLNILRNIKGEFGVVSLAGNQRTGKSYMLNLLLGNKMLDRDGFKTSDSTKSCT